LQIKSTLRIQYRLLFDGLAPFSDHVNHVIDYVNVRRHS